MKGRIGSCRGRTKDQEQISDVSLNVRGPKETISGYGTCDVLQRKALKKRRIVYIPEPLVSLLKLTLKFLYTFLDF